MIIDITKEFEDIKKRAGDRGGLMSYVIPMLEVITKNIRMVDKLISSRQYGSRLNEMGVGKRHTTSTNMTYTTPSDVSVNASKAQTEIADGIYVPGKGYAKQIPDTDCLGNRLWHHDGKPKMKTVYTPSTGPAVLYGQGNVSGSLSGNNGSVAGMGTGVNTGVGTGMDGNV